MKKTFLRKLLPLLLVMQALLLTSCDFGKIREIWDDSGVKRIGYNFVMIESTEENYFISREVKTISDGSNIIEEYKCKKCGDFFESILKDFNVTAKKENIIYFNLGSCYISSKKNYEITFTLKQKLEDREKTYTSVYRNQYLNDYYNSENIQFINTEDPNDVINAKYLYSFSQTI